VSRQTVPPPGNGDVTFIHISHVNALCIDGVVVRGPTHPAVVLYAPSKVVGTLLIKVGIKTVGKRLSKVMVDSGAALLTAGDP
jgi:hypothetical protein